MNCFFALLLAFAAGLAPRPARAAYFNDVLPGARPMGMGYAYSAIAEGPYAMYFNPAGLAATEFTELGGSIGRMLSPQGPLAFESIVYTRPFPLRPNSTLGVAFYDQRQNGGGDKDEFLFHFSQAFRLQELLPDLYLTRPLKVGANAKILSVDGPKGHKLGLGLDGGALVESNFGLKGALTIQNLSSDLGVNNPWITLGTAYTWSRRFTVSADLKRRKGTTDFFPGIEVSFLHGLLAARAGKGLPLDGIQQIAFGAGINFSPVILDFAMTIPYFGFTRPGGAYQASLVYRFGAPSFSGRFVGIAAREAEDIKQELLVLEDKRNSLQNQIATAEANKSSTEGQLRAYDIRLKSVQEELRQTQRKLDEMTYKIEKPKPPPPPPPLPVERVPRVRVAPAFPKRYAVEAGDTLRSIAKDQYGDASLWELIYNANRDKVERGIPQEGAILVLPVPPNR
ncbi:MAG: hypothetical protein HY078_09800 [Elusimicrobia bacterium]|nr:hypothetical protein [Elusimicrobiota bacterium]